MDTSKIKYNLSAFHNPTCDILSYQVDKDISVTYGIYVKPYGSTLNGPLINIGEEFMEVYYGENYNVNSIKRSYSRAFYKSDNKFPKKHNELWLNLKQHYKELKISGELNKLYEELKK